MNCLNLFLCWGMLILGQTAFATLMQNPFLPPPEPSVELGWMEKDAAKFESAYLKLNYIKAGDLRKNLQTTLKNNSFLSPRAGIIVDERTNSLIIRDLPQKIAELRALVQKLDVPLPQILIEARIVKTSALLQRELGIRWGISTALSLGQQRLAIAENAHAAQLALGTELAQGKVEPQYNINLGLAEHQSGASLGIALGIIPANSTLDLELSAFEAEGSLETISCPKVITSNRKAAHIEQGSEVPYQESAGNGATSTSFKKAVLSMTVTPQLGAEQKIILDLEISNDSIDLERAVLTHQPIIDTQRIQTQVAVRDGQTIVLGGIRKKIKNDSVAKVPVLGDLPFIGWAFKKKIKNNEKTEFMIFITPKIINI